MNTALLPPNALAGVSIGLSASQSADMARLGLMNAHFDLALRELSRIVLVSSGTLVYGGNLDKDGFTWVLINELCRYARDDEALKIVLHALEHRRRSRYELDEVARLMGLRGRLLCLSEDGQVLTDPFQGRGPKAGPAVHDRDTAVRAATGMRTYLTQHCDARLLIGGKRHDYMGAMPGVLEEALLSLRAGQPLFLAGGLGGMTYNLAVAVDPTCAALLPPHPSDVPLDAATQARLAEVSQLVSVDGWCRLNNGLDDAQNRQLAGTHRPAEMAALVSLGLGRWRAARQLPPGQSA